MDQLISDATRPSKNSAATLSLSTEIIIGLYSSSPLQKIRHILEAYQTLTREDKEKIIPKESNRKYMVKMRELCYSFMDMFDLPPLPYQFHNRKGLTFSFSVSTTKLEAADVPPPGAGLATVTLNVPALATSAALMVARNLGRAHKSRGARRGGPFHH